MRRGMCWSGSMVEAMPLAREAWASLALAWWYDPLHDADAAADTDSQLTRTILESTERDQLDLGDCQLPTWSSRYYMARCSRCLNRWRVSSSLSLSRSQDSWALRLAPTTLDCSINELPWNGFRTTLMSSMVIRSKSRSLARVPEAVAWRSIS